MSNMQPSLHTCRPSHSSETKNRAGLITRLIMSYKAPTSSTEPINQPHRNIVGFISLQSKITSVHRKQGILWGLQKHRSAAMWSNRLHMLGDQVISLKEDMYTLLHRKGMLGTKTLAANGLTCSRNCMCTHLHIVTLSRHCLTSFSIIYTIARGECFHSVPH